MNTNFISLTADESLFGTMSSTTRKIWLAEAEWKDLDKKTYLWHQGEEGYFAALIVSGWVEGFVLKPDGEEKILGIFGPEEAIGMPVLLKPQAYPGSARVISGQARLLKLFSSSSPSLSIEQRLEVDRWLQDRLMEHQRHLFAKLEIVGSGKVSLKIIALVRYFLGKKHQVVDLTKPTRLQVPLTKTRMAKIVEVRVETIIRLLNTWEKAGLVSFDADSMTINDLPALFALDKTDFALRGL